MSEAIKILTDSELALLRTRLMTNPGVTIDTAVVKRLLDTAEYYRDSIQLAIWPHPLEQVRI